MDRDTAIAQIQFDLGNRSDLFDAIALKLQQAQRLLEMGKSLPWFLRNGATSTLAVVDNGLLAIPDGFLREFPNETFHYTGENGAITYLEKTDQRNGLLGTVGMAPGRPRAYRIGKTVFQFFPAPDRAYTLSWAYYKAGDLLDSNIDTNAWLIYAPDVLIGTAGSMMAEVLQHTAAKARFDNLALGAWKGVFADGVLREEENQPLAMGSRL